MRLMLMIFSVVVLSGCVQHTKMIKPLPDERQGVLNIQAVKVSYSDFSSEKIVALDEKARMENAGGIESQSLKVAFEDIAKDVLEGRDSSDKVYADVKIEVDNLKFVNPMAAVLVGDSDQLSGSVRIVDSRTKELLSEFYVDVLKGTGGLLGLAVRGGGVREKLSAQFAEYIGDNLGFPKADGKAASNAPAQASSNE